MNAAPLVSINGHQLRTYSRTADSVGLARDIVEKLVLRSQWFVCEPMSDGQYEITVKDEIGFILDEYVGSRLSQ